MAFSNHDVVPDSPINNFATWNKSDKYASTLNLSEGNLKVYSDQATWWDAYTTISMSQSGKYYCEMHALSDATPHCFGVCTTSTIDNLGTGNGGVTYHTNFSSGASYYYSGGGSRSSNVNGVQTVVSSGTLLSSSTNDIVGILLDLDNDTVKFYIDNSLVGTTSSIISGNYVFFYNYQMNQNQSGVVANFGQDPSFGGAKSPTTTYPDANGLGQFHYQPPAGALALCTANIPEGPIKLSQDQTPSDNFKAVTWTGSNSPTTIDFNSFTPDLLWIKNKTDSAGSNMSHSLIDSVRGETKRLASDLQNSEETIASLSTFNSDNTVTLLGGYSLVNDAGGGAIRTYVGWGWRAAGSPADGGSSVAGSARIINEDGTQADTTCAALATAAGASITPSKVSANRQNGFSIVQFNGINSTGTLPHGLSQEPDFVIFKKTSATSNWIVHRNGYAARKFLYLNNTNGLSDAGADMVTSYSNSVLSLGTDGDVNPSDGASMIVYCWHSVAGYSKFGHVSGLNNDEYVYLGFRPSWVMLKRTSTTGNWSIYDNARNPHNVCDKILNADTPNSEITYASLDLLSNGFKVRSFTGVSGGWIYMAFSEQPFSGPSNAR